MLRRTCLTLLFLTACIAPCSAQDWARKMFKVTSHDFGAVARGSKQEFGFEFVNLYKEPVHIADVRSSCGCTTPRVTKDLLKTLETAEVVAVYNTRSFLGAKAATLTVVIDQPFYAEVQLEISGYIRRDVVFNPGEINLGSVDAAAGSQKKVEIAYAGREDWEIVDVRSANKFFEVELDETERGGGRVGYEMTVRLKPGSPPGFIHEPLTIVTNDTSVQNISLPVEGKVISPLTVSPAQLFLGVLKPGESVTKRLVLRAKMPFKIVSVDCDDCFQVEANHADEKTLHFVPVTYTADKTTGEVVKKIEIKTTLGEGLLADCVATATIKNE